MSRYGDRFSTFETRLLSVVPLVGDISMLMNERMDFQNVI